MKSIFIFSTIALFLSFSPVSSRQDDWQHDVQLMLGEFLTCGGPTPPTTPCNMFLARALKRVYNINDFDRPGGGYLTANEMADYVLIHTDQWTSLGDAGTQAALTQAQGYANLQKAVIAVFKNTAGVGHVALIVPGTLQHSGAWNLDCPNSASFFLDRPEKSYICKQLAYAFQTPDNVVIYGRNF
jgi:hypothetical protein